MGDPPQLHSSWLPPQRSLQNGAVQVIWSWRIGEPGQGRRHVHRRDAVTRHSSRDRPSEEDHWHVAIVVIRGSVTRPQKARLKNIWTEAGIDSGSGRQTHDSGSRVGTTVQNLE